ncbi:MAG: DUF1599 domain-containing protein [Planctomycetales bacterium]|nr:DUF1599 domain-containing protein [Planctomycetales bacterium]
MTVHLGGGPELDPNSEAAIRVEIDKALGGTFGEDQQRIASVGIQWLSTLLRKNRDYGSSAWKAPVLAPQLAPGDAILCRMSDKVERIARLLQGESPSVSESLEDTMCDLGAYALLWLARPSETPD